MAFLGEGERPRGELEPVRQTRITQGKHERSHAELMAAIRQAIRRKRQEGSNPKWPELGGRAQDYSPARIIREEFAKQIARDEGEWILDGIAPNSQRAETLDTILKAWDVIAYEHYVDAKGSAEWFNQHDAGQNIAEHYERTGQTTITLSEQQLRFIKVSLHWSLDFPAPEKSTCKPI